jgi:hypothetical protein
MYLTQFLSIRLVKMIILGELLVHCHTACHIAFKVPDCTLTWCNPVLPSDILLNYETHTPHITVYTSFLRFVYSLCSNNGKITYTFCRHFSLLLNDTWLYCNSKKCSKKAWLDYCSEILSWRPAWAKVGVRPCLKNKIKESSEGMEGVAQVVEQVWGPEFTGGEIILFFELFISICVCMCDSWDGTLRFTHG